METVNRYRKFRSGKSGVFFLFDKQTKKQTSLRTKDDETADRLVNAANEKERTPMVNRQIGFIYLASADSNVTARTWADIMASYRESKMLDEATLDRLLRAEKAKPMAPLVKRRIVETTSQELLDCLMTQSNSPSCTATFSW
jgi:hypothetical protein